MTTNLEKARALMLHQQLRAGAVLDTRVLETLAAVPREAFVPDRYRGLAFADESIPLACGQCMMTPRQEGLLLQALAIRPDDRVLEIGTGSGYLAACLARLAAQVTSIEVFPELADTARLRLDAQGVANCEVVLGDVFQLGTQTADVIAVTASLPLADPRFEDWLRTGGRLFQIVGPSLPMHAWRVERTGESDYRRERLFETAIPPLLHAPRPPAFSF